MRFTRRALDDIGVPYDTAPSDFEQIQKQTHHSQIVTKFKELRRASPLGTDGPMRDVGKAEVYSLHGPSGERACTWYDEELEVCWFLGFVAQHDYTEFETRALNDELLPSEDDIAILLQERGNFEDVVTSGVEALVAAAWSASGVPQRGTVGGLLALEVTVLVLVSDDAPIGDLYLLIQVPPLVDSKAAPTNWPGTDLLSRLAEIATGQDFDELDAHSPLRVPRDGGGSRPVNLAKEMAIEIRTLPALQSPTWEMPV